MSQLLPFLAIALLLLTLLLLLAQRSTRAAASRREPSVAREALAALQLELPPRDLVERIFAWQDWDFVSNQTGVQIRHIFLQERTAIALSWLRQTRKQAGRLMDFHLSAVRRNINLSPAIEIKLGANYVLFLLVCRFLHGLIWLRGPFRARRLVGYAAGVAEQLWSISAQWLSSLDPARRGMIERDWTHKSAAS